MKLVLKERESSLDSQWNALSFALIVENKNKLKLMIRQTDLELFLLRSEQVGRRHEERRRDDPACSFV